MSIHELSRILEVETPLGRGKALLIDTSDFDTFWTVVLDESCAIVTFRQHQLHAVRNYGMGWGMTDEAMRDVLKRSQDEKV